MGATAAIVGICLPGAVLMYVMGILYRITAPAAVQRCAQRMWQRPRWDCSWPPPGNWEVSPCPAIYDLGFVLLTVIGVDRLHQSVPRTLIIVGAMAILWYWPRAAARGGPRP